MNIRMKKCLVPYCGNNTIKSPEKVFIATPSIAAKRRQWYKAAGSAYNKSLRIITTSYCCEDHFDQQNDFVNWMEFKTVGTRLKLRPNVIPHIFKPKPVSDNEEVSPFLEYSAKESKKKYQSDDGSSSEERSSGSETAEEPIRPMCSIFLQPNPQVEDDEDTAAVNEADGNVNTLSKFQESCNIGISANAVDNDVSTSSEVQESCNTGIAEMIEKQPLFYLGLPKEQYFVVKLLEIHAKCTHATILFTLKKIRLDETFECLSRDFSLPEILVRDSFIAAVPKIAKLLEQFIKWPDCAKVLYHLPVQCRSNFLNVQSIIDFFEVPIEKPVLLVNQPLTWSKRKKTYTMRYFVSVNPNGLINFVSTGCGGATTQTEVIQNCRYLDVLPSNATIFANKNLTSLAHFFASKNRKFVTNITAEQQVTEEDADIAEQVSFLSSQIMNTVSKLSEFKILNSNCGVEASCIRLLDFIVTICCGLVNLQEPAGAVATADDCAV